MHETPKTPAQTLNPGPSQSEVENYTMSPPSPFPFATPWIPNYYPIPEIMSFHPAPSNEDRYHNSAINSLSQSKSLQFIGGNRLGDNDSKRPWRPIKYKVDEIFGLLKDWQWSIGDLLYYIFAMKDAKGNQFEPTGRHTQMVSKFLTGETQVGVSQILDLWLKSPYANAAEREFGTGDVIFHNGLLYLNQICSSCDNIICCSNSPRKTCQRCSQNGQIQWRITYLHNTKGRLGNDFKI